jgi:hypothetical protein
VSTLGTISHSNPSRTSTVTTAVTVTKRSTTVRDGGVVTHRPIPPIEINGFEPRGTPRALPIFEWVDPATLLVDEGYRAEEVAHAS